MVVRQEGGIFFITLKAFSVSLPLYNNRPHNHRGQWQHCHAYRADRERPYSHEHYVLHVIMITMMVIAMLFTRGREMKGSHVVYPPCPHAHLYP